MNIRLSDLPGIVWLHRGIVLLAIFAMTGLAAVVALTAPLSYESKAVLRVSPAQLMEAKSDASLDAIGQQERRLNSLAALARSEDVMRAAVDHYGVERLIPNSSALGVSDIFWSFRSSLHLAERSTYAVSTEEKRQRAVSLLINRIRASLVVSVEPKTDLVSLRLSHRDPAVATGLLKEVIAVIRARTGEQGSRSDIASFLADQRRQHDEAFVARLKQLTDFSTTNAIFSVDTQRTLLLDRQNVLVTTMQKSANDIVEKENQMAQLSNQLQAVFPIEKYPQIRDMVQTIAKSRQAGSVARLKPMRPALEDDKLPLLLVKVYQETIQSLFKLQTEVAGLLAVKQKLTNDAADVNNELNRLALQAATFERMQMDTKRARETADQYAIYATNEQIKAAAAQQGLTPVDVMEAPNVPVIPIFPNPVILLPFGMLAGLVLGLACAVFASTRRQPTQNYVRFAHNEDDGVSDGPDRTESVGTIMATARARAPHKA